MAYVDMGSIGEGLGDMDGRQFQEQDVSRKDTGLASSVLRPNFQHV
jgi:hypothetical protein